MTVPAGTGGAGAPLRAHSLHEFDADGIAALRAAVGAHVSFTVGPGIDDPERCEVLVAGVPTRAHLAACPRLRVVVIPWAGVSPSARAVLAEFPGVAVHNLHHNAAATAEHGLALLLAAARRLVPSDRGMRAHDWRDRGGRDPALPLGGRTVVILGFGAVGRRLGVLCRGIGMHVVGVRRNAPEDADADGFEIVPVARLDEALPRAQVLAVTVPGTNETTGLLDARRLALLPRDAVLVNVGRGAVIDEAALFDALSSGRLHGAGLDVWWRYPKGGEERAAPSSHPFETLDNVVMTPHRAGTVEGIESLRATALAEVLLALARGEAAPGRVDVARGY